MSYYELSRLLGAAESLHARYEQAKNEKRNEAMAREVLNELELTLAQIDRQTAPSPSVDSSPTSVDDHAHPDAAPNPLPAVLYTWVGGFWIWVLATCLEDQYPAVKALIDALH